MNHEASLGVGVRHLALGHLLRVGRRDRDRGVGAFRAGPVRFFPVDHPSVDFKDRQFLDLIEEPRIGFVRRRPFGALGRTVLVDERQRVAVLEILPGHLNPVHETGNALAGFLLDPGVDLFVRTGRFTEFIGSTSQCPDLPVDGFDDQTRFLDQAHDAGGAAVVFTPGTFLGIRRVVNRGDGFKVLRPACVPRIIQTLPVLDQADGPAHSPFAAASRPALDELATGPEIQLAVVLRLGLYENVFQMAVGCDRAGADALAERFDKRGVLRVAAGMGGEPNTITFAFTQQLFEREHFAEHLLAHLTVSLDDLPEQGNDGDVAVFRHAAHQHQQVHHAGDLLVRHIRLESAGNDAHRLGDLVGLVERLDLVLVSLETVEVFAGETEFFQQVADRGVGFLRLALHFREAFEFVPRPLHQVLQAGDDFHGSAGHVVAEQAGQGLGLRFQKRVDVGLDLVFRLVQPLQRVVDGLRRIGSEFRLLLRRQLFVHLHRHKLQEGDIHLALDGLDPGVELLLRRAVTGDILQPFLRRAFEVGAHFRARRQEKRVAAQADLAKGEQAALRVLGNHPQNFFTGVRRFDDQGALGVQPFPFKRRVEVRMAFGETGGRRRRRRGNNLH